MKDRLFLFFAPFIAIALGSLARATAMVETRADSSPVQEGYHIPKIVDYACGDYHNLAIDSDGNLWQWGCSTNARTIPQQIMGGTKFKKVAAGLNFSAALDVDGNAYSWSAYDTPSLLGSGYESIGVIAQDKVFLSETKRRFVSYAPLPYDDFAYLFFDSENLLDVDKRDRSNAYAYPTVLCGDNAEALGFKKYHTNNYGQWHYCFTLLDGGMGDNGFSITPIGVRAEYGKYVEPFVLNDDNYLWRTDVLNPKTCAGGNLLSVVTPNEGRFLDFAITKQTLKNIITLDQSTGFALRSDGVLLSFGYNNPAINILGSDETLSQSGQFDEPKQVKLDKKAIRIEAGASHAIALCEDGNLYAWGANGYGQLGLGDKDGRTLPTLIPFFQSNTQYSFTAAKGETYDGSFAIAGMNTYTIDSNPSKGNVVLDASTGAFSYTPDANATDTDYFAITASDGIVTKTYLVNVTIDYKPNWQNFETSFVIRPGQSFSSEALAADQDGDILRYSIVQYPTQGEVSIGETSGMFVYSAHNDGAGDDSFMIAVTDGHVAIQKTINVHIETYIHVDDDYERDFDTTSTPAHFEGQLNAVDEDGDTLSWSVISEPSLGALSLNPDTGAYSYDADSGKTGDDHFVLEVTDDVYPIQKEYTIHLYSIKDAGTCLVNVTTTGHSFSDRILTSAQNTVVSYGVKTQGEFGDVTIDSESGEYAYTPLENTRGQDSFIITVFHTYGSYELKIFVYQNSLPNDALVETNIVVAENGSYSGSVACSDLDLGDTLSYSLKNNPMKGNVELDTSTGAYTYTALPGLAGDDAFSVKVSDGFNEIMIAIGIHIESQLQTETNIYRTTSQNVPVEDVIVASDKDGDALSYSLKSGAANGVAQISNSGSYHYTPDADFYGDDSFLITVTDGVSPVDVTIHIHMNRKPIAVNDMISVVANGSSITASVSAEDADGDALTYSVYTQPSKGVAAIDSNNGKFAYTPNYGAAGDDWFVIKASDGTDYVLITVHVHNETELEINTTATTLTASQGKTLEGAVVAVDADGDTLSYRVAVGPNKGVLNLNSHTGSWSYACNSDAQGEDSFEIAVTDGVKEKNVTFHININIPPKVSAESKLSFVTNQGTPYIGTVLGVDGDGDSLTYIVISQGQKGSVIIDSSSGQYTYMPHEGAFGNDQFVLGIMDGVFLTQVIVSAHIETDIVVNESVQNVGVDKGGLVCGNVIASDADGDVLSYSISSEPTKGVATVDPNGAWSFLADGADAGTDSFVIAVTDGTHTKYVTIHVHIDTTPAFEAESQTISVPGNRAVTDHVLATDLDGDQLTYSLADAPKNGTVNLNSKTGSYTYTNTIKATSDTFKIKVVDTNGNEATIVIYVRINNAPTIQNLALSVHQGESVEGQLIAADGEGDPLTYSISAQGKKGLASVDSGSGKVVYVAERGASGVDTFVVSVSDGANVIQTTVMVNIQANSAPFSPTLSLTTKQGAPVSGTIGATDADGDDLSFELSIAPLNGVVSVDPSTGSFVYTPYHNFSGTDSFNIRVFDGLDYGEATVNVSVEKNEAPKPKAERQNYSVAQGNSFSGTIEVDDMEGDDLSFSVAEKPRYGSVQIDQKTGTFNYQANPFASGGLDSFTVEVSDGFNVSRVMVQVSIDSTVMNIGFVAGGAVAYTGVVVAAVLIVIKLRKKGV